MLTMLMIK